MLTPEMSRAARGLLDWTLKDLADAAGVGLMTISAFERGRPAYASTRAKLAEAFERAGVELIQNEARIGATILAVQQQGETVPTEKLARIFRTPEAGEGAAPVTERPKRDQA